MAADEIVIELLCWGPEIISADSSDAVPDE